MVVIFEFLGQEPIENVITCMHYPVDKVVYFGYQDTIKLLRDSTNSFLTKYCGVNQTEYHTMPKDELSTVYSEMQKAIEQELAHNNQVYFDITGGESLILVAFGMLAKEFGLPMHHFDVPKNQLIELHKVEGENISEKLKERKINFTLNSYIELRGGKINIDKQKDVRKIEASDRDADVKALGSVVRRQWTYWNVFSGFMRENATKTVDLSLNLTGDEVRKVLKHPKFGALSYDKIKEIVEQLKNVGLLINVGYKDGGLKFQYKNLFAKESIWDGGSILEMLVYQGEKKKAPECMIGVHIDWDGEIHYQTGGDVLNEIDVLTLNGNIPTFISCKSGKMDGNKVLPVLYELETIAKRFGGKYSKKVLVLTSEIGAVYKERAVEMGIEIRYM